MNLLQVFEFIASYVLQTSLVIGVAWGLDRWAQASLVKTRIWTACYVTLLVLFVAGLMLPRFQLLHPWSSLQPKQLVAIASVEGLLGYCLVSIWAFGSSVMLVRWITQFFVVQRFIRACPKLAQAQREQVSAILREETRMFSGQSVEFRISPEELGPFCYQFHRPLVFLPKSLLMGDQVTLGHVLSHELTHLKTQHPLQLFCQKLVQVLLWFHPLVWISCRRANLVREFVCDDASSGDGGSTSAYLRTLVKVVENRSKLNCGTLAIGRSKKELTVRARRLVQASGTTSHRSYQLHFAIMLATACFCSLLSIPTNPASSPRSHWSPWPTWSQSTLHAFDIPMHHSQELELSHQLHEWIEDLNEGDDE